MAFLSSYLPAHTTGHASYLDPNHARDDAYIRNPHMCVHLGGILSSSGRTARVGLAISSRAIRGERAKGASPVRLVVRAAAEDDVLKVRSIPSPAR